jgi:hypothetical protein
MRKTATVWTQAGCGRCREEISLLRAEGYAVRVVVVDDPDAMDFTAFVQLQMQDGMLPVVRVEGVFRTPAAISGLMEM